LTPVVRSRTDLAAGAAPRGEPAPSSLLGGDAGAHRYPEGVRHSVSRALLAALGCAAALIVTGILAFAWPAARAHDAAGLADFLRLAAHPLFAGVANGFANSVDPLPYALIGLALAAVALARRRGRLALAVPLTMFGASATSELLKRLIANLRYSDWLGPSHQISASSWPSGHATAAMMVALCAVLVAPAALRPLVALLGSVLAAGVSYSILMLGWHFPSDVLGGFMVAGTWVSLSIALLWWSERRWPVRRESVAGAGRGMRALFAPGVLGAAGVALALAALAEHGRLTPGYLQAHAWLVLVAAAIAVVAALMATAVAVAMRPLSGSDRGPTTAPRRRLPPAPG
jgi:membrane-associated phospholipid phosphatase